MFPYTFENQPDSGNNSYFNNKTLATVNTQKNTSSIGEGNTPSWWPTFGNIRRPGSNTGSTGGGDWLEGVRHRAGEQYGTERPAGGVEGGKISSNGLYWINPDGTLVFMGNKAATDPNVDQSYRNIGKGDMFSGVRDGKLWVGGNYIGLSTGNPNEDQATLYQFGYRPKGQNPQGWNVYDGLGVGAPTGGAQGRWMGSRPIDEFRSNAGWAQQYSDEDLYEQLFTITQRDYDLYSPEQQRRIKAILRNSRPDLNWGNFGEVTPVPGAGAVANNDPYASFRRWQAGRR